MPDSSGEKAKPDFDELLSKSLEHLRIPSNFSANTVAYRGIGYAQLACAVAVHAPSDSATFDTFVDAALSRFDEERAAGRALDSNTYQLRGIGYGLLALATAFREQATEPTNQ